MWALQNPSKQLPQHLEIEEPKKGPQAQLGQATSHSHSSEEFSKLLCSTLKQSPVSPLTAQPMWELLILALDAPCQGMHGPLHPALSL